ncbi:MAG: hypothetical protein WD296_07500 [Acidimicrobiia bacterium]
MRRVVLLLCVLLLATIAVTASAATKNLKVEDVGSVACGAPVVPSTSTTTTTTTTTPTGCQTSVVCPSKADNHDRDNDHNCDGNNGGGNG